mmetsp:Transcript_12639/g.28814  ORF Transcript_12639/g.28814 Transcript_12639/m.28814 type:complete len:285 (-) Transcript_12639:246-1100(-)
MVHGGDSDTAARILDHYVRRSEYLNRYERGAEAWQIKEAQIRQQLPGGGPKRSDDERHGYHVDAELKGLMHSPKEVAEQEKKHEERKARAQQYMKRTAVLTNEEAEYVIQRMRDGETVSMGSGHWGRKEWQWSEGKIRVQSESVHGGPQATDYISVEAFKRDLMSGSPAQLNTLAYQVRGWLFEEAEKARKPTEKSEPTQSNAQMPTAATPSMEPLLKASFALFDADGNGFLSPDELKAILTRGPSPLTDAQVDALIKRFDANHDGMLSIEEFARAFSSMPHSP